MSNTQYGLSFILEFWAVVIFFINFNWVSGFDEAGGGINEEITVLSENLFRA